MKQAHTWITCRRVIRAALPAHTSYPLEERLRCRHALPSRMCRPVRFERSVCRCSGSQTQHEALTMPVGPLGTDELLSSLPGTSGRCSARSRGPCSRAQIGICTTARVNWQPALPSSIPACYAGDKPALAATCEVLCSFKALAVDDDPGTLVSLSHHGRLMPRPYSLMHTTQVGCKAADILLP